MEVTIDDATPTGGEWVQEGGDRKRRNEATVSVEGWVRGGGDHG